MKIIKNFEKFDKQEIIKENKKTLSSFLINESASEEPSEFNLNSVTTLTRKYNATIILKSQKYLMLKINDYEAAIALGSTKWGFDAKVYYEKFADPRAYMLYYIYDFTKSVDEKEHLFAISVGIGNEIIGAMWYDGSEMENPNEYCEAINIDDFED